MSDIRDNPPPLPVGEIGHHENLGYEDIAWVPIGYSIRQYRAAEAAAFSRGVAAGQASMQGEIDDAKALLAIAEFAEKAAQRMALAVAQERDELRAKLKALEEQKSVAWYEPITQSVMRDDDYWNNRFAQENGSWFPLVLPAGAKP